MQTPAPARNGFAPTATISGCGETMSLLDSQEAIGAVTELLRTRVSMRLNNLAVVVGRPEAATNSTGRKLNLFLYRIGFDGSLRNIPLDSGQQPPLWLVLHYLVTAFDENKESDSAEPIACSAVDFRAAGAELPASERGAAREESGAAQDHVR